MQKRTFFWPKFRVGKTSEVECDDRIKNRIAARNANDPRS